MIKTTLYDDSKIKLLQEELVNISRKEILRYPNSNYKTYRKKILKKAQDMFTKSNSFDIFFWPNALLALGIEYSHKLDQNSEDFKVLLKYFDKWYENGQEIREIDHVLNGYSLIYVYEVTKEPKYLKMIEKLISYINYYEKDGLLSLPYRPKFSMDIYIDTLGMICPFLCRYGELTGQNKYIEMAMNQLINFFEYGFDYKVNLPYHAFNLESKKKYGIIGWGRAVGWLLIGLVDSLEYISEKNKNFGVLNQKLNELLQSIYIYQTEEGYFSWQLETISGPMDSSSTSMINYATLKAVQLNLVSTGYKSKVKKSIDSLLSVTQNGYVKQCSAECKGLGQYPQIYDWYPWSQGPTTALFSLYLNLK